MSTSETSAPPPADKKEYKAPLGTSQSLNWRSEAGRDFAVQVTSEWIVLRKREKPAAEIFHTYYRVTDSPTKRAITFVFNGGPGAASAYLHIGGLGPQRVCFEADGNLLPPPIQMVNNSESWIE